MEELSKEKAIAALIHTGNYSPEKAAEIVDLLFSIDLRGGK